MPATRPKVHSGIYLDYLLHYIAHWPVTAADLKHMALEHGFSGFANFFASLPERTMFGCPEEIKMTFDVSSPSGKVTGFDNR